VDRRSALLTKAGAVLLREGRAASRGTPWNDGRRAMFSHLPIPEASRLYGRALHDWDFLEQEGIETAAPQLEDWRLHLALEVKPSQPAHAYPKTIP